jgi:hypothetical protein
MVEVFERPDLVVAVERLQRSRGANGKKDLPA